MEMSAALLSSIEAQLEQTSRLVHSLYDSGDLSVDQYDAIVRGLSGAALLRKEVAQHQNHRRSQALAGLQAAWDSLGRCVDEFEPSDMSACSERRDALDTAILATLAAWKESR